MLELMPNISENLHLEPLIGSPWQKPMRVASIAHYACIQQDICAIRFETQRSLHFEGEQHENISS
jgi:hypothetical protein